MVDPKGDGRRESERVSESGVLRVEGCLGLRKEGG